MEKEKLKNNFKDTETEDIPTHKIIYVNRWNPVYSKYMVMPLKVSIDTKVHYIIKQRRNRA